MPADDAVALLALPAAALEGAAQPAVRDAVRYFDPDLIAVPGPRNATAEAAAREAAPNAPVLHPQLARPGERILQYRYTPGSGLRHADDAASARAIDVIAVQSRDLLSTLRRQLRTDVRRTGNAATFLVVPELSVEHDPTNLSATLPDSEMLAAIRAERPEPVTVLAGDQPATYYHEWPVRYDGAAVSVPVAGLGATGRGGGTFTQYNGTVDGAVAAESVAADQFGLRALRGVGATTADRLRTLGCQSAHDVGDLAIDDLADLTGVGRPTARRIHAHADVIESGEPIVFTNKTPVKTRDGTPPLCLDIETDGLSPTIIWQFGVYDPASDTHRSFTETETPDDPKPVLEAFLTWLFANHGDRTVLTWNGYGFDYQHISRFVRRYLPEYVEAWDDVWTYDLYKWAVRDDNALLHGRTNKLDHVARALGYEAADTGLSGAKTAAAYQQFMRDPEANEPDWDRHEAYCEDDCRALFHVYEAITDATRRDMADSGAGGAAGTQAGLTDF